MDLHPVLDFMEFSLLPFLSQKEIQLAQLKITQSKPKSKDALFLQCFYFNKAIDLIRKYKRQSLIPPQSVESSPYFILTKMDPQDVLLVLAKDRYDLSPHTLSLTLKKPIASLEFRRKQIEAGFEKLATTPMSELNLLLQTHVTASVSAPLLKASLTQLGQLPAPMKFILEMGFVLLLLFSIMWLVPQVRDTYENSVQKRINEYLIDATLIDSPPPEGLIRPKVVEATSEPAEPVAAAEVAPINPQDMPLKKQPKVRDGETWRFSFTGQGQSDLEAEVGAVLEPKLKEKVKASLVPGGIQFVFDYPTNNLIDLKKDLELLHAELQKKIAKNAVAGTNPIINLSWYKKRINSSHKIPAGHVQVIVWISTL